VFHRQQGGHVFADCGSDELIQERPSRWASSSALWRIESGTLTFTELMLALPDTYGFGLIRAAKPSWAKCRSLVSTAEMDRSRMRSIEMQSVIL